MYELRLTAYDVALMNDDCKASILSNLSSKNALTFFQLIEEDDRNNVLKIAINKYSVINLQPFLILLSANDVKKIIFGVYGNNNFMRVCDLLPVSILNTFYQSLDTTEHRQQFITSLSNGTAYRLFLSLNDLRQQFFELIFDKAKEKEL